MASLLWRIPSSVRLSFDAGSTSFARAEPPRETKTSKLTNPFLLNVSTTTTGVKLSIRSEINATAKWVWLEKCENVFRSANGKLEPRKPLSYVDGKELLIGLRRQLEATASRSGDSVSLQSAVETEICLPARRERASGATDYEQIVLLVQREEEQMNERSPSIIGLLSEVWVQYSQGDDDVIQASHPSNYLIVSTGRILQLQKLYSPERRCDSSCSVCQLKEAKITAVPCGHCCTCRECIRQLSTCPLCREPISSYFAIGTQ
ncbi:uncharacterized protein [Oscarella lobularis]|uniref:uncharacterized protein n=1 Tax=Oscarella lobularis TaxID=121494 RepID=UPI0033139A23